MKISLIAAMAENRVIGKDNDMPWHMPADLQHFKKVTLGKPVVMGRKTYESIGRLLPGRPNIIVSRDQNYRVEGAEVVSSPELAVAAAGKVDELMIIGGGNIYQQFLPLADRLYLTFIDLNVDGDTQFPDYMSHGQWSTADIEHHLADEKNKHNYRFVTLDRVN